MAELTEEQIKAMVESEIARRMGPERLPAKLTLQVLGLVAVLATGAATIVAAGFTGWAGSAARAEARSIAQDVVIGSDSELVSGVSQRLQANQEFRQRLVREVGFPPGSVVAFASECPSGWEELQDSRGRFVVGVGEGRALLSRGGEAEVSLTEAQMPVHTHSPSHPLLVVGGDAEDGITFGPVHVTNSAAGEVEFSFSEAGQGQPHNNVPPYIALHWCTPIPG